MCARYKFGNDLYLVYFYGLGFLGRNPDLVTIRISGIAGMTFFVM